MDALVIQTILSNVPHRKVIEGKFSKELQLADPAYYIPKGIDMLIGAELFFDIISEGQIKDEENKLMLHNTKLGWIVSGSAEMDNYNQETKVVATVHKTCDELLGKFWEIEEMPQINKLTVQEKECEHLFNGNFKRHLDGKFQVKLPFKLETNLLGNSSLIAKRRYFALERKLDRNTELKVQYH